jgi:adenine/guanine phosphoribosyltransferase-like PRPP-binding protein
VSRADALLRLAQSVVDAAREGFLFGREVALTLRQGAAVVRDKRAEANDQLRESVDELRARLKLCEDECRMFRRSGGEATS